MVYWGMAPWFSTQENLHNQNSHPPPRYTHHRISSSLGRWRRRPYSTGRSKRLRKKVWLRLPPSRLPFHAKFLPLGSSPHPAPVFPSLSRPDSNPPPKADHYFENRKQTGKEKGKGKRVVVSALWKIIYSPKDRTPPWKKKTNHEKRTQFTSEWTSLSPKCLLLQSSSPPLTTESYSQTHMSTNPQITHLIIQPYREEFQS